VALDTVVRARIHPAIGIARIGNSDEWFIGPELPYSTPPPEGGYRDASGRLKRQAARFRIFGYDEQDQVVAEITGADAEIAWEVHVANKKAAWYEFEVALDLPEAAGVRVPRRNATVRDRGKLVIDAGPQNIRSGEFRVLDEGRFFDLPVTLGELQTDDSGRLVFTSGRGVSGTPLRGNPARDFADNDGWHDDTCDGPVRATVRVGDRDIPVEPAWVVVAPPNYAPGLASVQTMFDVIADALGLVAETPSFTTEILPLFEQLAHAQWVNYGFFTRFGWRSPHDFLRPDVIARLSGDGEFRRQMLPMFRNPDSTRPEPFAWPPLYGDAFSEFPFSGRYDFAITRSRYRQLERWAAGDFVNDYDPGAERSTAITSFGLDKAALYFCMGGPFHPGIEMTWPMRHASMYSAPFRLRERTSPEPDYGEHMTSAIALMREGPLYSSAPGDLTRWMAVPWQTDTASCYAGYPTERSRDPYLPAFWPARVPNHVLTAADYEVVMDAKRPMEERVAAFTRRRKWSRRLDERGDYEAQINAMVRLFGEMGVVESRPGPGLEEFPNEMYVESLPQSSMSLRFGGRGKAL
jgi:hypothetical protein